LRSRASHGVGCVCVTVQAPRESSISLHLFFALSIRPRIGDQSVVAADWRDERIAELEQVLAR
jgi:hypothetical protein